MHVLTVRGGAWRRIAQAAAQSADDVVVRVRVMDRIGLAAALFTEADVEQATDAAQPAIDEATRVDPTLVA